MPSMNKCFTFFTFWAALVSFNALARPPVLEENKAPQSVQSTAESTVESSAKNSAPLVFSQQQLENFIQENLGISKARVEIVIGKLDPRLKLRPCAAVEPFLPTGTRLWGRANVGLRCREPGGWTVFLPVEVKVFGQIAVAARTLHVGETLTLADITQQERDITRINGTPMSEVQQLQGRVLVRGFAAGQPLIQQAFRASSVVSSGDPVKVVVQGAGFAVSTAGVALAQAELGQAVRIRLDNGRTLQGIAHAGRVVEIKL